jgi:hypothetical protein
MYRFLTTVYLLHHMPSAHTMLKGYQAQISAARGAGMAGVGEQSRLAPTVRALLDVVNADYDPRGSSSPRE